MPFSVQVDRETNKWEDISYRQCKTHKFMYTVLLGDKAIGQVSKMRSGDWWGISYKNPEYNWLGTGFSNREHAVVFILRVSGYYKKDRL